MTFVFFSSFGFVSRYVSPVILNRCILLQIWSKILNIMLIIERNVPNDVQLHPIIKPCIEIHINVVFNDSFYNPTSAPQYHGYFNENIISRI